MADHLVSEPKSISSHATVPVEPPLESPDDTVLAPFLVTDNEVMGQDSEHSNQPQTTSDVIRPQ